MPCTYDTSIPDRNLSKELEKTTRMLCSVLTAVDNFEDNESEDKDIILPHEVITWWAKHKELDRKRAEEERQRKTREQNRAKALNKLTPSERKLLGL